MTSEEELHAALEQLENLVYQLENAVTQLGLLNLTLRRLLNPCPDLTPSPGLPIPPTHPT